MVRRARVDFIIDTNIQRNAAATMTTRRRAAPDARTTRASCGSTVFSSVDNRDCNTGRVFQYRYFGIEPHQYRDSGIETGITILRFIGHRSTWKQPICCSVCTKHATCTSCWHMSFNRGGLIHCPLSCIALTAPRSCT